LTFDAYVAGTTYGVNELVTYLGGAYISTDNGNIGHLPNEVGSIWWQYLGAQYAICYAKYPAPVFNSETAYAVGDQVYWKGSVYTCIVATVGISLPASYVQVVTQVPFAYTFPDTPVEGAKYWGIGVPYTVAAGVLPNDLAYWLQSDNRSQQLVGYATDLSLFYILQSIAPQNIPVMRVEAYKQAIAWLENIAHGVVTAQVPRLPELKGNRIRFGGNWKTINGY
jgi:hypothetical protein